MVVREHFVRSGEYYTHVLQNSNYLITKLQLIRRSPECPGLARSFG